MPNIDFQNGFTLGISTRGAIGGGGAEVTIVTEITPQSTNDDAAGAKAVYDFVIEKAGATILTDEDVEENEDVLILSKFPDGDYGFRFTTHASVELLMDSTQERGTSVAIYRNSEQNYLTIWTQTNGNRYAKFLGNYIGKNSQKYANCILYKIGTTMGYGYDTIAAQEQADWNTNATTAASYIQNRPFYEIITTDTKTWGPTYSSNLLADPELLDVPTGASWVTPLTSTDISLVVGETYGVNSYISITGITTVEQRMSCLAEEIPSMLVGQLGEGAFIHDSNFNVAFFDGSLVKCRMVASDVVPGLQPFYNQGEYTVTINSNVNTTLTLPESESGGTFEALGIRKGWTYDITVTIDGTIVTTITSVTAIDGRDLGIIGGSPQSVIPCITDIDPDTLEGTYFIADFCTIDDNASTYDSSGTECVAMYLESTGTTCSITIVGAPSATVTEVEIHKIDKKFLPDDIGVQTATTDAIGGIKVAEYDSSTMTMQIGVDSNGQAFAEGSTVSIATEWDPGIVRGTASYSASNIYSSVAIDVNGGINVEVASTVTSQETKPATCQAIYDFIIEALTEAQV